ncbi:hypothetical protein D0T66_07425 [Dysgonomonas sp. 25]|nr:hypothetical protein [Dysgonomonas sp. 25]
MKGKYARPKTKCAAIASLAFLVVSILCVSFLYSIYLGDNSKISIFWNMLSIAFMSLIPPLYLAGIILIVVSKLKKESLILCPVFLCILCVVNLFFFYFLPVLSILIGGYDNLGEQILTEYGLPLL